MYVNLKNNTMATYTSANSILIKKKETILRKEILFLEKNMANYKAERKSSWKLFKSKMEVDLAKIRKSMDELYEPTVNKIK